MLAEFALGNLKPRTAPYKIADRDGMYVAVSPAGTFSFRYDYRINGRRETLTIGRYGRAGISLALAREKLHCARRAVREGKSPAVEKQREKQRRAVAKTFGEWADSWLDGARMADTTRSVRKGIVVRDVLPAFNGRLLCEVTADDLRALCMRVKERGAPATAVHLRDIVKQIYAYANLNGEKVENPADEVGVASIATFVPKDRVLSPLEIRFMHRQLEQVATYSTIRLALRLVLLTMVRKSELIEAESAPRPQRIFVPSVDRHHGGVAYLRSGLPICPAFPLCRKSMHVQGDIKSGYAARCRTGKSGWTTLGAIHRP